MGLSAGTGGSGTLGGTSHCHVCSTIACAAGVNSGSVADDPSADSGRSRGVGGVEHAITPTATRVIAHHKINRRMSNLHRIVGAGDSSSLRREDFAHISTKDP